MYTCELLFRSKTDNKQLSLYADKLLYFVFVFGHVEVVQVVIFEHSDLCSSN